MALSTVEFLIYPFHDSQDMNRGIDFLKGRLGIFWPYVTILTCLPAARMSVKDYLDRTEKLWEEQVCKVAQDSESMFVMFDIETPWRNELDYPRQLGELREKAEELGDRFIPITGVDEAAEALTRQDLRNPLTINAYGETYRACVSSNSNSLAEQLRQRYKEGISINLNVVRSLCSDQIEGKFGDNPELKRQQIEAYRRLLITDGCSPSFASHKSDEKFFGTLPGENIVKQKELR